jgi:hypothetical protein
MHVGFEKMVRSYRNFVFFLFGFAGRRNPGKKGSAGTRKRQ